MTPPPASFVTRASLAVDLTKLGLAPGDAVMVHAAVSKVGRLLDGPDTIIAALCDVVGHEGTVLAYADWEARYEDLCDEDGRVPPKWRDHIPPFDPQRSRAIRDNGVLPEFLRTTRGALRSSNPGASIVALGAKAALAGKTFLWSLGALGAQGPGHAIDLLIDELQSALGQVGARSPDEARNVMLRHPGAYDFARNHP